MPSEYELEVSKKLMPSSSALAMNGRLLRFVERPWMCAALGHAVAHAAQGTVERP